LPGDGYFGPVLALHYEITVTEEEVIKVMILNSVKAMPELL